MMSGGRTSTLSELLSGIVDLPQQQDGTVSGLALNSNELQAGELFVALVGTHQHGADFIPQAIAAGAVAVLCEKADELNGLDELSAYAVPVIIIEDLSQQLGWIASRFYHHPSRSMTVIGITGTNGKTTCCQLLARVLSENSPCGVIGTLGYGLYGQLNSGSHTTPNAIEVHRLLSDMLIAGAEQVVMERSEERRVGKECRL